MRNVLRLLVRSYQNLMLRSKMTITFSVMAILLLVVQGSVIYAISVGVLRNEMKSGAEQTIEQTSLNINSYFEEIKTIIQLTANNRTLIDAVENYDSSYVDQLTYNENLQNILSQYTYMIPYVDNILVVKNGRAIYDKNSSSRDDYDFNAQPWFASSLGPVVRAAFTGPHPNDYYYDGDTNEVISVIIPVRDPLKMKANAGAIVIDIDIRKITSLFGQIGLRNSQRIAIVDAAGKIVADREESESGGAYDAGLWKRMKSSDNGTFTYKEGNSMTLVVFSTSPITGWKTVIETKMTKISQVAGDVRFTALLTILFAILLAMGTSLFLSSKMSEGIIKLKNRMDQLSRGNELTPVEVTLNDEIGMLGHHYNRMVARLNQAINDNYIVKIKQKEAELSALQSKINPHFLNNTLQSLHAMAVLDKTREIETTIESLGSLFDYVLYETGDIVKAQEEMNYLESYLQIQQSRNSKRFEYAIEADAEAANCRMPKLLIQPIVENAILHGLGDSWSGGLIEVRLHYSAGRLEIRVTDNGKGMTAEQREHIDRLLRDEDTGSRSIGLKNVYDRLRLIHGSEGFTFGIESSPGEGTTILVGFPASTEY